MISHSGTRNYVNSVPTPLKTLKDLGESFIELYAPGEHQSLCDNARQLELLDRYACLQDDVKVVREKYRQWQGLVRQEAEFYQDLPDGGECEILRYQVDEIKKASLKKDEDIEVNREYKEVAGSRESYDLAYQSCMTLGDEQGLRRPLQQVMRSLMQMENLADIKEKIIVAEKAYLKVAKAPSKKRKEAAPSLAESIASELQKLDFKQCIFAVDFAEQNPAAVGIDAVEFQFAPNAGEGINALKDVASSGEISRIMLAVKSVLASVDRVPVLIFDEIDANVGGTVASKVARKLHQLGENHQVFCITHTPQVAAGGHAHYRVEKNTIEGRTYTEMITLSVDDKVSELSRMLGGDKISSVVEEHARELIAFARG